MQYARNVVFVCASLLAGSLSAAAPANPAFDTELLSIQQAWARVNYEMPAGDERARAFDELEKRAENFTHQNPARPDALIWEGIIESSYAGAKGGLGALSLCKEARGNLETALKLDPTALDGSAYTSLGALYYPEALQYLVQAGKAAPRPGREVADKGRRGEIAALTAKVKAKAS